MENEISARILHLAGRLDSPRDYFRGLPAPVGIIPNEVLCYLRTSPQRLLASNPQDRDIHHRHVLIIPLAAEGDVSVDARTHRLGPGRALLVFPFQFHHYAQISGEPVRWLFITFECGDHRELVRLRESGPVALDDDARQRLEAFLGAYQSRKESACVSLLLEWLLRALMASAAANPAAAVERERDVLEAVNGWVMERISDRFQIGDLAAALGFSESHLRALFRKEARYSLGKHIRRLRLLRACQLLHVPTQSISEVAEQCGFDSVYSFSRAFRHHFSTTPTAYRRKMVFYHRDSG